MLRILKDGKPVSLKEQEKLINEKGSIENCGQDFSKEKKPMEKKSAKTQR